MGLASSLCTPEPRRVAIPPQDWFFSASEGRKDSPERSSIRLVVKDAYARIPPVGEVVSHDGYRLRVSSWPLQEATVFPDDPTSLVTGQFKEALARFDWSGGHWETRVSHCISIINETYSMLFTTANWFPSKIRVSSRSCNRDCTSSIHLKSGEGKWRLPFLESSRVQNGLAM